MHLIITLYHSRKWSTSWHSIFVLSLWSVYQKKGNSLIPSASLSLSTACGAEDRRTTPHWLIVTTCLRRSGSLWEHRLVKVYKPLCTIWPGHNLNNIIILQPFILRNFHAESIVNIFHTSPRISPKCNEICFQRRKCSHCCWETSQTRERILQDTQQRHWHLEHNIYNLYSYLNSLCM